MNFTLDSLRSTMWFVPVVALACSLVAVWLFYFFGRRRLPISQPDVYPYPLCTVPPPGWACTRERGHDGPCAAIPICDSTPIENARQLVEVIRERDELREQLAGSTAAAIKLVEDLNAMRERKDGAYVERNRVVAALAACYPSGTRRTAIEGWDPEWHGCVYIDLPTGQVSWHYHDSEADLFAHLPRYRRKYDGHSTSEKYERVDAFARNYEAVR